MGTGVDIVLGRITRRLRTEQPYDPCLGKTVISWNQKTMQPEDFTLMDLPEELYVHRNYDLFSWLADERYGVKPRPNMRGLKGKSLNFLKWLDQALKSKSDSHESIFDTYDMGERDWVIYLTNELLEFNYDQVAPVSNGYIDGRAQFIKPVVGKTYRMLFGEDYFRMLEYCRANNWDFIIFGFN